LGRRRTSLPRLPRRRELTGSNGVKPGIRNFMHNHDAAVSRSAASGYFSIKSHSAFRA
jgi:hypothetical protein